MEAATRKASRPDLLAHPRGSRPSPGPFFWTSVVILARAVYELKRAREKKPEENLVKDDRDQILVPLPPGKFLLWCKSRERLSRSVITAGGKGRRSSASSSAPP
jgi:hypothetical protein